jgi:AcrR family transcriptional regulator
MEKESGNISQNGAEQRILAAAQVEFLQKGQNGARMEAIARRAKVNKALIHYYYRSKSKLYQAVLEGVISHIWDELEKSFSGIDETADIRTIIRTLVSTYINVLKGSPGFPQLFLRELADGGGAIPQLVEGFLSRFGPMVSVIFSAMKKGVQSGKLRPIDPVHVLINIMGMCAASFILKPVLTSLHERILHAELAYDEKFFAARITAITEMALEGIVVKGEAQ